MDGLEHGRRHGLNLSQRRFEGTFTDTANGDAISGTATDASVMSGGGMVEGYHVTFTGTFRENGTASGSWQSSYPGSGTWTLTLPD